MFPSRHYVRVNVDFDRAGSIYPLAIIWEDGRRFPIESIQYFRPAYTEYPGLRGDCYTVRIRGKLRRLYFEPIASSRPRIGRWWVESGEEEQA